MGKALLIIDVQNDYFVNGNCELFNSEKALEKIKKLLKHFRENKLPIYYIKHISDKNSAFFVPETHGVDIHSEIEPLDSETVVIKNKPNSFFETNLQQKLEECSVTELVVCGMMTHMCVDTTVRAAKDLGYEVKLISDACATKELEWNGIKISADTVQNVYMASLNKKFADIMICDKYLKCNEKW